MSCVRRSAPIRSALEILASHVAHPEGKARKLYKMAARNADRLLSLVSDLLDIERLKSRHATLAREPVRAADLLDQARDAMQPLADNAEITFAVDAAGEMANADLARVQQVRINLIGNGIKFTPACLLRRRSGT